MCPVTVKEFLDQYGSDLDVARITAILTYFRTAAKPIPPIEVLPYSHKVYSILLNTVLHDALIEQLSLIYDADAERMVDQISDYMSLKQSDVVFLHTCTCGKTVTTEENAICPECHTRVVRNLDLRYIDILPSYRLNDSYDPDLYRAMLQLIRALFPTDSITDGDTVNV